MSFCKNCGRALDENEKFCSGCGAPTTNLSENENSINSEPQFDAQPQFNNAPQFNPEQNQAPNFGSNMDQNNYFNDVPKPKGKKKLIFGVAGVLLLAVIAYFAYGMIRNYIIKKDPVNRTFYGAQKTAEANYTDATETLKFAFTNVPSDSESQQISKYMQDISIRLNTKSDKKSVEARITAEVLYKDQPFLKADIYADKEGLVISIPDLYDKNLYIKWDELNKLMNEGNANSKITIENYKSLISFDGSKYYSAVAKDYGKFFRDNLKDNFKKNGSMSLEINNNGKKSNINCDELVFSIDETKIVTLFKDLATKAVSDSNVKNLVKEKMNELFTLVEKNGDLEKFDLTKDDIKSFQNDFDKDYDNAMNELKDSLKEVNPKDVDGVAQFDVKSSLRFDSNNYLRGMYTEIKIGSPQDEVGITITSNYVVNSVNESLNIQKLDKSGINLANVTPEDEQDVQDQIQQNIFKLLGKLNINMSDLFGY